MLFSIESTNVTDGRTPHDAIGRACIASRIKNKQFEARPPHPAAFLHFGS